MPPNTVTIVRRLRQYTKVEASASVAVALDAVVDLGNGQTLVTPLLDEYPLDADLTAHAQADGRDTWDESDLCALCDCDRGPQPAPPPEPDPEPVPDPEPGPEPEP